MGLDYPSTIAAVKVKCQKFSFWVCFWHFRGVFSGVPEFRAQGGYFFDTFY